MGRITYIALFCNLFQQINTEKKLVKKIFGSINYYAYIRKHNLTFTENDITRTRK